MSQSKLSVFSAIRAQRGPQITCCCGIREERQAESLLGQTQQREVREARAGNPEFGASPAAAAIKAPRHFRRR